MVPVAPSQLDFSVTEISSTPAATLGFTSYGKPSDAWGTAAVDVADRDVSQVLVTLHAATVVRGTVDWDSDAPPQLAGTPRVRAEPAGGSPNQPVGSSLIAANSFVVAGLTPGRYSVTVAANRIVDGTAARAHVRSVRLGSRVLPHSIVDVTAGQEQLNLAITLTFKESKISGDIAELANLSGGAKAWVAYFPADQSVWGNLGLTSRAIGVVAVDKGHYKIPGLPAGQYYLVATVDDLQGTAWQDARFLESLAARAQPVTVDWGDSKSVRLTPIRLPK
jgi:hypothetical protein